MGSYPHFACGCAYRTGEKRLIVRLTGICDIISAEHFQIDLTFPRKDDRISFVRRNGGIGRRARFRSV